MKTVTGICPEVKQKNHLRLVKSDRRSLDPPRLPVRISLEKGLGRSPQFAISKNGLRQLIDLAVHLERWGGR